VRVQEMTKPPGVFIYFGEKGSSEYRSTELSRRKWERERTCVGRA
jgi:hypothetical protein